MLAWGITGQYADVVRDLQVLPALLSVTAGRPRQQHRSALQSSVAHHLVSRQVLNTGVLYISVDVRRGAAGVCWNQGSRQCPSSSSLEARPAARFRLGDSVAAASWQSQLRLEHSSISGAAFVGPSASGTQGCTVTYLLLPICWYRLSVQALNLGCARVSDNSGGEQRHGAPGAPASRGTQRWNS
jgi:hypothetical protein